MQVCSSPYRGIDFRKHEVIRELGRGAFGWVDLASVRLGDGSTQLIAVKNMAVLGGPERLRRVALRELEGMVILQGSPYGVRLYGSTFGYMTEEDLDQPLQRFQLFMEVAEKGTLQNELVDAGLCLGLGSWPWVWAAVACGYYGPSWKWSREVFV